MPIYYGVSFDQAYANVGYAVLSWNSDTNETKYLESGTFSPSMKLGHFSDTLAYLEHMKFIKDFFKRVEKEYGNIVCTSVEGVALGAPGQASARGGIFGIYSTMCVSKADLIIISPKKLKSFITGNGNAEKEEIAEILFKKYGEEGLTEESIETYDQTDAVGLGEIGLYCWRYMQKDQKALEKELNPLQQQIIWGNAPVKKKHKSFPDKQFGICTRIDDFYMFKRGNKK